MGAEDWRKRVIQGNLFDNKVQADWERTVRRDGGRDRVTSEAGIRTASGRRGRMDVYVEINGSTDSVAIIENKDTHWDGLSDDKIAQRVQRHARQVWKYIEAHLGKVVAQGVIVRKRPDDASQVDAIRRDDRRNGIKTLWAKYDHLRPEDEVFVTDAIVVKKRPHAIARRQDIMGRYAQRGITAIWDKDLERTVYPGITLSKRPTDRDTISRIEEMYGQYGIAVVWDDETMIERRARA